MAGLKGRSGRRSCNEERDFQKLITKSFNYLYCNFEHFNEEKRFHLALEIVKKAMPTNLNGLPPPEKHYHYTTIQLSNKSEQELMANLLGRPLDTQRQFNPANVN